MPFTSRAEVKRYLRIPTAVTTYDDEIDEIMEQVHATILEDIGGGLTLATTATYTQKFDVDRAGLQGLRLPRFPVLGVTYVKTGTRSGSAGTTLADTDWYATDEGTVRLQGTTASWPVGQQQVEVQWQAGFVPGSKPYLSLALAEKMTVAELVNTGPGAGKKGEKVGRYSYTREGQQDRGGDVYPAIAARIVARYRRVFAFDPVIP